ncbi:hypothetical protein AB0B66_23850 [Catellatospora sp. NPDC049111]|uniref:hypothetical protein n=1 Tax=Catellatospora sp. NPDC049111 TaxID=3155271 RepID=UPI0033CAF1E2
MTDAAFHPQQLTANAASLNHVILGPLGAPAVNGRLAQDACSRDALLVLASEHALNNLRKDHLSDDIGSALAAADSVTAARAAATLHSFGLHLGNLIATLRDPATAALHANSSAYRAFFEHWLSVDSVWLAGGLLVGACGPLVLAAVREVVGIAAQPCPVGLLYHPHLAPLVGAARHIRPDATGEAVIVADLGQTRIKTAVAEIHETTLTGLRHISVHPAPRSDDADEVEDAVAAALTSAIDSASTFQARVRVIVSVASFVADGLPANDGQGVYGSLAHRTAAVTRRIEAATGVTVRLRYMHDGTAAASAAITPNSATITVGTWLGVGFQPRRAASLLHVRQPLATRKAATPRPRGPEGAR